MREINAAEITRVSGGIVPSIVIEKGRDADGNPIFETISMLPPRRPGDCRPGGIPPSWWR
ncbi:hypothetical protein GR157_09185 [Burkholderia sp. 4701]|nr:hypothetical protein [Burkholderia sp. 4701]MXN81748.1 hypothetical protein [Burkholderia sp. 4812]